MARTYETIYDTDNAFDWAQITNTYIDGVLTIENKLLDTGFSELTFYRDGYVSSFQVRDSAENRYNWDSKSTAYDATGAIIGEYISYDNGRYVQMNISDGVVTSKIIQYPDTGAANALTQLSTIYGDGEVVRVFGSYANGTTYQDEFTDGVRDTRYWSDFATDGSDGAKPWTSITIKYDIATNQMTDRTTYFDNGIKRTETFEDGTATTRLDEDRNDVQDWDTIAFNFDADGKIASRATIYDDGDTRVEQFVNGVRTQTIQQDDPNGTGANTQNWETIITAYDGGVIAQRTTLYDDGTAQQTFYVDGIRDLNLRSDVDDGTGGIYVWDTILTGYDDAGRVSQQAIFYDNADLTAYLFDEGVRQTRLEYDNDNSDEWYLRVTDYGAEGNTVTTYATINDVPPEYADQVFV